MRLVADIHSGREAAPIHRGTLAYLTASAQGRLLSILTEGRFGSIFVTLNVDDQSVIHSKVDVLTSINQGLTVLRADPACPPLLLRHLERATQELPCSGFVSEQRSGGLSSSQLETAKNVLASRLDKVVTISEVATACGISRGHLNRSFRRMVGSTPMRWRMEVRLNLCRRLLLESDHPIAEVARAAGFGDPCYFSRAFTQASGLSPRDWRRVLRDGIKRSPSRSTARTADLGALRSVAIGS